VLATSREPLHVAAERVYVVEPLPEDGAVTLFVERGRRLRPSLTADDEVARLCRRLDGLALAVELAAARVNVLTPRQILERLDRRLELLSSGPRDVPARHRTLRAAIEWSYDCLANGERRLFARLAAFSESFSLEAAEAVCNADVDTLASLVDKSLIHRRDDRFALLDTVREYATEVLEASGDAYELRRVHAEHYLGLIDRDDMRTAPPHVTAVIASEYGNLRASLAWTIDAAPELALRLAAALSPFWNEHGMFAEGRQWLDRALQRTPDEPSFARASALTGASWLAHLTGDHDRTKELAERAVMAGRAIDNPRIVVQALNHLGSSAQLDDGTYEHARRFFEEAAVVARAHGDELGLGSALTNLGVVASSSGDWDEALGLFSDALLVLPTNALLLLNLALAELETGHEAATVAPRYEYVFRRASDRGDPLIVACALLGLGLAVARAGFCDQAVRVLGAASAQREALDYELELPERLVYAEIVDDLHARLGQDAFGDAWADGRMLEAEEAFALGLEAIHAPASARRRSR
jgi:tetratricopeptide (TPR) repeat protein